MVLRSVYKTTAFGAFALVDPPTRKGNPYAYEAVVFTEPNSPPKPIFSASTARVYEAQLR